MDYSLTAEELILSLVLIGGADAAFSFKEEAFGEITNEVMDVYLDSAVHGLISKGLMEITEEGEKLEVEFEKYLLLLKEAPRVLRCQIMKEEDMHVAAVYCHHTAIVQYSTHQSRVHTFTKKNVSKIFNLMDISNEDHSDEPFSLEELEFEQVIDTLLEGKELSRQQENLFSPLFLEALQSKKGKLNSLFDYKLNKNDMKVDSFLYITHEKRTWRIEQAGSRLFIRPFTMEYFFELTS